MKKDLPDVFRIKPEHEAIHERLENWAHVVRDSNRKNGWSPMFRWCKSNSFQWHPPEYRPTINLQEAYETEKQVAALPDKQRDALRWWYVYRYGELKARKQIGVTSQALCDLVHSARQMLVNRLSNSP